MAEKERRVLSKEDTVGGDMYAGGSLVGKVLVLDPYRLAGFKEPYREAKFQLWECTGGKGAERSGLGGTSIYAKCLADDEFVQWHMGDFIGEAKPEVVKEIFD